MPCRATQDGSWWRVLTKHGPLEKGMALQYSCLENPMNSMKRQKDLTLKDELPRSVGTQYVTAEEQRKKFRRNEQAEPNKNNIQLWMCLVVEVKSDAVKNNTA